MAACKPIAFTGIDRIRFQAIRARVRAQATSTTVDGDTGTATGQTPLGEVTVSWSYDEPSQTLTVQCVKKPWCVSEDLSANKIRSMVESL